MPELADNKERFSLCCSFGRVGKATFVSVDRDTLMASGVSTDKRILRLFPDFSSPLKQQPAVLLSSEHLYPCS